MIPPLPDPRNSERAENWDAILSDHAYDPQRDLAEFEKLALLVEPEKRDEFKKCIPGVIEFRKEYSCSLVRKEVPSDYWWSKQKARPWQLTEHRLAKVFIVSKDVLGFKTNTNWSEIIDHEEQLVEGYMKLGYKVEIFLDDSESLLEMLKGPADHRPVLAHGELYDGVRCTDRFVSWKEIEENIGPTGLAHFMSCWSADARVWDDDDSYSFGRGLLHAACSAVILTHNQGHHFPGDAKSGGNFEIQRMLGILKRCHKLGLEAAMESYRAEYEEMLGPIDASILTDHEVASGNRRWGLFH